MRRAFICFGLCAALFAGVAQANAIYQWTDAQGSIHYGSKPPDGVNAKIISTGQQRSFGSNTEPAKVDEPNKPATQADIDKKVQEEAAERDKKLQEYCTNIRNNLAQLKYNSRVMSNENGVVVRLTEEERQARIVEAENGIKEYCKD
ncbi:DUF4124 domain-containing protein [Pseudomonas sp. F1_0610]|uniref:DUF4124 domain-containing protein n=1 Tax=Pseudomonas sp. F1_0610 TaxID=3114284 RepID=UPI0039C42334